MKKYGWKKTKLKIYGGINRGMGETKEKLEKEIKGIWENKKPWMGEMHVGERGIGKNIKKNGKTNLKAWKIK